MMQEQNTPDLENAGEEDPRKQLWIRAGVAIGLISVLLGGLAVFDRLSRPPVPEEVVAPTRPIAPAQVASDAGRDAPPDVLKAGATESAPGSDVPPLPAEGSVPPLPGPGKDEGAVKGERSGRIAEGTRPLVRTPAPGHAAAVPPAQSQVQTPAPVVQHKPAQQAGAPAPAVPVAPAPAAAAAPSVASARPAIAPPPLAPAAVSAPLAAKAPAAPASPAVPPTPAAPVAPAEGHASYALQVGVFATPAQAAALQARLSAEGIPSRLETRVVVGPFADRRDALAAQARLRDKGFSAGELIPFRR